MPFESVLKKIFESGIKDFNQADYEKMRELFIPKAHLISLEINLPKIQSPAIHLKSFDEIIAYWSAMNANYENRITNFEYLEIGKISKVRCFYEKLDLIIDSEFHFDNYAKIIKIVNHQL